MREAAAAPPNGIDLLRGRWDGTVENLNGADQPFTLLFIDFAPDPNDSEVALGTGCIAIGEAGMLTPIAAARAVNMEDGSLDLTVFGTVAGDGDAFTIRLTGLVDTFGAGVPDDRANGEWTTVEANGSWSATHHDRRRAKCPMVQLGNGLTLSGDVYAAVSTQPDGGQNDSTILEVSTNLASSAVRVDFPNGSSQLLPAFTDIFSPDVDFVETFRFVDVLEGLPVSDGTYSFTLLDPLGGAIEGATASDTWLACTVGAPRNVSATVEFGSGIRVEWDPVSPAPGFDPGGAQPIGFYQIGLDPDTGGIALYGANDILQTSHLIPQLSFSDSSPGSPDGFDFGKAIEELVDGTYAIDVIAFSEALPSSTAMGLECQARALSERVRFEKSGTNVTILP